MFLIDVCFCFVIVTLLARLHCLLVPHAIPLPLPRHNWLKLVANWEYIIGRPPYDEYVKYKKSDRILSMNCKIWKWFDTNSPVRTRGSSGEVAMSANDAEVARSRRKRAGCYVCARFALSSSYCYNFFFAQPFEMPSLECSRNRAPCWGGLRGKCQDRF